MDSCKEGKQKQKYENECKVLRQKLNVLETEIKELKNLNTSLQEQCKQHEKLHLSTKEILEEQAKANKDLEVLSSKYSAKIEDLKKEIEHEKKLTEELQTRNQKSNMQKNLSEQVDVN